jgi:UPF0271 protein
MGEGFGAYELGRDDKLMRQISSANIACGFHAGDPSVMQRTVSLAERVGVAMGAHPGFPDLIGFGRREMAVSPQDITNYVIYQVGALQAFTRNQHLQHVKPHGALYNMGVKDESVARAVVQGIREVDPGLILVGLAGSNWIKAAVQAGVKVASEVFADRAVNADGTLVPRSHPAAVIEDVDDVISRSLLMVTEGKAISMDGQKIPIRADTICLHSDTPGVVTLAEKLREKLEEAGVEIVPMGEFL